MSSTLLKPLGSGKYSDVFVVTSGQNKFAMKISYYREETVHDFSDKMKNGDIKGAQRVKDMDAVSVSRKFSEITKILAESKITPHFVHVYSTHDVKSFIDKLPIDMIEKRLKQLSTFQKRYNNVTFMELFSCDLTSFLTKTKYDETLLRSIIFQILYTIAATQKVLPGWRHNDLSTNNVLVKKVDNKISSRYFVNGENFYIDTKIFVAITDFDFVHVPNIKKLENKRVTSGNFKVEGVKNNSYDTHFFLKSILKCLIKRHTRNFQSTIDFLKDLDLKTEDRQPEEIHNLDPLVILNNEYFDSLKKEIKTSHDFSIDNEVD
ncbi:serine/threonine-protein kinase [Paramecium bursaria Chlorella virus NY2B]|uniref:Serine/threonine-protein kinase n=1 Tax=Paramecium bursaria Chlorella virus NYs1 TaxID=83442 RepID=M1HHX7_9PHYC|nr:hypothetical protein AR158_C735R [Paramecium bursaria Chlorella virus AR158]YP_009665553.1 serine/threonine-protein kinase [Paramecium bursaria Chlorella virus NYs1]AGE54408.1 serine/threonine-protein kinase [Paramecium bursaria Chlorella virus IL-5-2s1]AGE55091.1 serine/threonine-protein kinase [Paramecium bursaria Chlorella virus MA1D]AGE58528.1 serine/threonine-protein kinase [Paramecium bursaria Chlorella virus NY2B]ABU44280.1 hypothetical protein AR158_C735R [Paramecium bursaria Chlore